MTQETTEQTNLTLEEREQALLAREQALAQRERQEALQRGLSARGLPPALTPFLGGPAEETDQALDALSAAWEEAVQTGVRDRLRMTPPAASGALPNAPDEAVRRVRAAMGLKNA